MNSICLFRAQSHSPAFPLLSIFSFLPYTRDIHTEADVMRNISVSNILQLIICSWKMNNCLRSPGNTGNNVSQVYSGPFLHFRLCR
jgi:hypothetical protein